MALESYAPANEHVVGSIPIPKVSVVIPTLNEADNIPFVLPQIPRWVHEVIVVDGCSEDDTPGVATRLWPNRHIVAFERRRRNTLPPGMIDRRSSGMTLRLVHQDKRGKGNALRAGFEAATGDIVVMLDADGSMNPQEIATFLGPLLAGADFVKGSRFLQGGGTSDMPWYRFAGNLGFVWLVRLLYRGRFSDLCYGYIAFWRRVLPDLDLDAKGFEIETLMNIRALQAGLKIAEVPSFEAERIYGTSRLKTIPDGWRVLRTIVNELRRR
jgi:glycosyltransferase involved in cell wall biosynthesis